MMIIIMGLSLAQALSNANVLSVAGANANASANSVANGAVRTIAIVFELAFVSFF